ncbi:MAG: PspC domain-containing protein [Ignavibacteriales bacterium]|nr:PspC domain-containing protein [Ignavibacteriales bacterium]
MKRLYRSLTDRKLAGICGGLGEYLDVDPTVVRLAAVIICFATGFIPLVVAYIVAWFIVPEGSLPQVK